MTNNIKLLNISSFIILIWRYFYKVTDKKFRYVKKRSYHGQLI